nr:uncharacterized protein LOC116433617 isoform X1 [Nomia melanderi]
MGQLTVSERCQRICGGMCEKQIVESSKCPESRKPHSTSCTIFYNCVNLPDGGYVWVPRKCTEGLVFQPYLRMCILPGDSWTCDTLSTDSSIITNRYDTPELIDPNETSYMGSTEDPSNFSELVDSSYTTDSILDPLNQEIVTPYPLIKIEEAVDNQQEKVTDKLNTINNLQSSYKREYSMLNRLMYHLLIHKGITIPLEVLASLTVPSRITSDDTTQSEVSKTNQHNILMSHFTQNLIQQTNIQTTIRAVTNLQNTIEHSETTKNENTSVSSMEAVNDTLEALLGDSENENSLILISNNNGNKQYLTVESYKSLGYFVDPKFISVIPCVKNVRMPNATDCVKYYVCEPERVYVIEYSCPSYSAFNKYTRICDRESYNKCVENNQDNAEVPDSNTKMKVNMLQKVCTERGKTKDPTSDAHYYICYSPSDNSQNLKFTRLACPNNLIFCQSKKVCTTKRLCKTT